MSFGNFSDDFNYLDTLRGKKTMEKQIKIRHKNPLHHVHYYQLRPWKRSDSYISDPGTEYRNGYDHALMGLRRGRKGIEYDNGCAEGAQDHKLLMKRRRD